MVGSAEKQQPIVRSSHRHASSVSIDVPLQLEMILQALEYETAQGLDLQEFFNSTAGKFKTETGWAWAAEIVAREDSKSSTESSAVIAGEAALMHQEVDSLWQRN